MATWVPEWHERAACAAHRCDAGLEGTPPGKRPSVAARYCAGCPVMAECAAEALSTRSTGVVRAGIFIPATSSSYLHPSKRRVLQSIAEEASC